MKKMYSLYLLIIVNIIRKIHRVSCTIDVNLSELEYLAGHMNPFECRQLIAALHYTTYDMPNSIAGAIRKVDENISCLGHLLHWNSSPGEGRGKTHGDLEHRLRQINRNDLANWLGKTVFRKLRDDLHNALDKPFGAMGEQITEAQYPLTIKPTKETEEENPWQTIDTLVMAVLVILLACVLFLIVAIAIHKTKMYVRTKKNDQTQCNRGENLKKLHSTDEDNLLDSEDDIDF